MREITKTISVSVDDRPMDFRLTKLDAFSGVSLLRMLARLPSDGIPAASIGAASHCGDRLFQLTSALSEFPPPAAGRASPERVEGSSPTLSLLSAFSDADLRSLMTACLEYTEVLLPAGWMPVMTRGEWSYPELEHDAAVCLKLTIEEVLWTLEGFFGGGASASRAGTPDS